MDLLDGETACSYYYPTRIRRVCVLSVQYTNYAPQIYKSQLNTQIIQFFNLGTSADNSSHALSKFAF